MTYVATKKILALESQWAPGETYRNKTKSKRRYTEHMQTKEKVQYICMWYIATTDILEAGNEKEPLCISQAQIGLTERMRGLIKC